MKKIAIVALSLSLMPMASHGQVEVKEIATRPGVTLRFVYAKADNPVASAVLFQGGPGAIGIFPNGSMRVEGFLSGGAHRFTQNGISVVIPDVPSDRRTLDEFRDTPEHAQDNAALIVFLREQSKIPVWAVGISNGSLSAAAAATHLKEKGPDGLVLTSSVTSAPVVAAHSVLLAPLHEVKVPVLLVHHKQDGCRVTPYDAMPALMAALKSAKKVELISEEGGSATGNPCHTGYHQFLGVEAAVTKDIAEWIKRYQAEAAR
ncbi:MAG: alpha/beta hydrolase [Rhodocyclales bacterium]|nr:alpha/beta hydrolase [Rhodocyclales bacterium]